MKLMVFLSALISVTGFAKTQFVECKNGNDYEATLSFEIPESKYTAITKGEIEYRGEELIDGLYPGQTTGDDTSDYGDMQILNRKINGVDYVSFQGSGWNPAYDDPNFYALVIPLEAVGKNLKNGDVEVFLAAYDGRTSNTSERAFEYAMGGGPTKNCWTYVK